MGLNYKSTDLPVMGMDGDKGIVTLYASAFGNIDSDGDVMEKGAFTKTIQERGPGSGKSRIKHLYQHDRMNPIGVPITMEQDENGLLIQSKVSDVKNGDYIKLYRDGVITEHSIGFEIVKSDRMAGGQMTRGEDVQYIKEVKLWEYSAVTWGANENTPVVGMKSLTTDGESIEKMFSRLRSLQKAFRNGDYTDETFEILQLEIDDMERRMKSLIAQDEPTEVTTKGNEPSLLEMFNSVKI